MKKRLTGYFFFLTFLLLVTGCSKKENILVNTTKDETISTDKAAAVNKTSTTPSSESSEKKADHTGESLTTSSSEYRNERFGFSIVFPESWDNKYKVVEKEKGIAVYFKPKEAVTGNTGLFFTILQKSYDLDESWYDSVGDSKYFDAKGVTYFIGGPTDVNFPPDHPEFDTFLKMNQERVKILSTLKSLDK